MDNKQHVEPWSGLRDEDKFIMNPLCRLHRSKYYASVIGDGGEQLTKVHRAVAVVLGLCDGTRTLGDVSRIARPLVRMADERKALEVAGERVREAVHVMRQLGRRGDARQGRLQPATRGPVLLTGREYETIFGSTGFEPVKYDVREFLDGDPLEGNAEAVATWNLREDAPVTVSWGCTSACSTHCRYCFLGARAVKPLPKARVLELIDEAARIGVVAFPLAGNGDAFMYPHLEEILASLGKHRFLPMELSTKSELTPRRAAALASAGTVVQAVQFSIDSTVGEVAGYLVRRNGYLERTFTSIDAARRAGLRVHAKAVITPYNILTIPRLYRDLKRRGVEEIRLASYVRSAFHHSEDLFNHLESYLWLEKELETLRSEFPDDDIHLQNGPPRLADSSGTAKLADWPHRSRCIAGRTHMVVCSDGKVIPCGQMPEREEYFCGDVSGQSIQEVWDSERMRRLTYAPPRERFRGQPCFTCAGWDACMAVGNCIRDLALHYGGIYKTPPNCPKFCGTYVRTT